MRTHVGSAKSMLRTSPLTTLMSESARCVGTTSWRCVKTSIVERVRWAEMCSSASVVARLAAGGARRWEVSTESTTQAIGSGPRWGKRSVEDEPDASCHRAVPRQSPPNGPRTNAENVEALTAAGRPSKVDVSLVVLLTTSSSDAPASSAPLPSVEVDENA